MNNRSGKQGNPSICLHCMQGTVENGRCTNCGRPNYEESRIPRALPFGYGLKKGRYLIGRVLGHGGFGITYMAWDQAEKRRVAVKELFPSRMNRDTSGITLVVEAKDKSFFQHVRKRFGDEARVISSLRGAPEIVKIYDCFEANGTAYFVMEYLDGTDLQHVLADKQRALTWQELASPTQQVLRGLGVLHSHGLIHRDISPDNIFVCTNGRAMLIDFGSVRREDAEHFTTFLKDSFAPPEQFLSNGDQGYWTDTYSLCATLYYLLSGGQLPAGAYERVATFKSAGRDPIVPLEGYSPQAPGHVCRAIMYGLNLDAAQRFRSVEEMQKALFVGRVENTTLKLTLRDIPQPAHICMLECVQGRYAGKRIYVPEGKYVTVGRGEGTNEVPYPNDPRLAPGISREQCVFYCHKDGRLYVQDRNSTYGTYVDRQRLRPMAWQEVRTRQIVGFGNERFCMIGTSNGGIE